MKRIVIICPHPKDVAPGQRLKYEQYIENWEKNGFKVEIKPFMTDHPNFLEDIPISIAGVGFTDDYEGDLGSRRTIIYTLDFEMRTNFYGNIPTSKIIRKSVAKIFNPRVGFTDPARGLNVDSDVRLQTVQIDPNPITTIGDPDSDFGFTTTIWGQDSDGGFGS